jgi:hypothetical protein
MATTAFSAQGSKLEVLMGSPPAFAEIKGIKGLKGPGVSKKIANKTNLASAGNFEEFQPLMNTPTPVTFQLVWNPGDTQQAYLLASNRDGDSPLESFKETFSDTDGTTQTFGAYVTKFEQTAQSNELLMADVELTPTGEIT